MRILVGLPIGQKASSHEGLLYLIVLLQVQFFLILKQLREVLKHFDIVDQAHFAILLLTNLFEYPFKLFAMPSQLALKRY